MNVHELLLTTQLAVFAHPISTAAAQYTVQLAIGLHRILETGYMSHVKWLQELN